MKNATEVENVIITDAYYFLKRQLYCNPYPWRIMNYKNRVRTLKLLQAIVAGTTKLKVKTTEKPEEESLAMAQGTVGKFC